MTVSEDACGHNDMRVDPEGCQEYDPLQGLLWMDGRAAESVKHERRRRACADCGHAEWEKRETVLAKEWPKADEAESRAEGGSLRSKLEAGLRDAVGSGYWQQGRGWEKRAAIELERVFAKHFDNVKLAMISRGDDPSGFEFREELFGTVE
jgi:hypothetical protein